MDPRGLGALGPGVSAEALSSGLVLVAVPAPFRLGGAHESWVGG